MPQFGLNPAALSVFPNQAVVYNDGGTGIRRQLTALFEQAGIIETGGDADRPMSQWKSGADYAAAGIQVLPTGEKFRYVALNGLRVSRYDNEYGTDLETWYLA
jgi:hypothetical protein